MKLHELRTKFDKLEKEIIEAGGVITPGQEEQMNKLVPLTKGKLSDYGFKFLDFDSDIEMLDAEIKRLQQRKSNLEGAKNWLLGRAQEAMKHLNLEEIKSPLVTLKVCKNPPSCEIVDKEKIPKRYITTETIHSIDKSAILKDLKKLKEGEEIKGAKLITDRTRLKIS